MEINHICRKLHRKAWFFSPRFALTRSLSTVCVKRAILRYFRARGILLPNTRVLEGVFSELSLQYARKREYTKILFMKNSWIFMIINVEKNTNTHEYTRIRKNKIHEKFMGHL